MNIQNQKRRQLNIRVLLNTVAFGVRNPSGCQSTEFGEVPC